MKSLRNNRAGVAHIGLILLVAFVVAVAGFAYWRINNSKKTFSSISSADTTETVDTLPQNLENLKTLEEIESIAGVADDTGIIKFTLETKDGGYVYKVILSNGKKLVINAANGQILAEETTDVNQDEKIPSDLTVTVSPLEAYEIAVSQSSSAVKSIEMEVEDKEIVYKIEFKDGSKIEIDATNGTVLKSELKNESESEDEEEHEDEEDEEEHEDEKDEDSEEEDHSNEDSDDSVDNEDHEEEDR